MYVTFAVQLDPAPAGVQVGIPIVPNVPFVGNTPFANVNDGLSISEPLNVIVTAAEFFDTVTGWLLATGASFTPVTVIETVAAVEDNKPSLAVNVKLSGPL